VPEHGRVLHRDQEAFITAHTIFDRGGMVLMYAEGGRSRTGKLGEAKPGLGRLALEAGAPVVPVAIHGSEKVRRGIFPKITVQFGEPVTFPQVDHPTKEQSLEVAEQVFEHIRALYEPLADQGRRGVLARLRRERRQGAPVTG
jgi:1-acyl-sn-glycerol-3-phosphate acyltransferase